jgi:predicted RNA-binding Zn ribbon-like protein
MEHVKLVCDFVNTADLEDGVDRLGEWPGLGDLDEARALREALRELLRANNGCDADREGAAAVLDAVAAREGIGVRFVADGVRLEAPHGGLGTVVAAAAQAMADGIWPRLKACRSDTCRWAFVDRARNHSRRWCSMRVCGNREKVRAFRRRHGAVGA